MTYTLIMTNGELYHHGVKGQKWGVRRYQNYDGTLTSVGKKHEHSMDKKRKPMSKETKKKIAIGVSAAATAAAVTAIGIYAAKNPEAIKNATRFVKNSKMNVKDIGSLSTKGKQFLYEKKIRNQRRKELSEILGPVSKNDRAKQREYNRAFAPIQFKENIRKNYKINTVKKPNAQSAQPIKKALTDKEIYKARKQDYNEIFGPLQKADREKQKELNRAFASVQFKENIRKINKHKR